jgi:hypothetical protein
MGVPVDVRDVFSDEPYPVAELAVAAGVLPYAFDDAMVSQFVKNLRSEKVYIRLPCSVGAERATASGHSAALGREYAARYHAVEDILVPLRERYDIERIDRVYPDDIESEFGTKQFAIVGSLR